MNGLILFLWNIFTTHQAVRGQPECDFSILGRSQLKSYLLRVQLKYKCVCDWSTPNGPCVLWAVCALCRVCFVQSVLSQLWLSALCALCSLDAALQLESVLHSLLSAILCDLLCNLCFLHKAQSCRKQAWLLLSAMSESPSAVHATSHWLVACNKSFCGTIFHRNETLGMRTNL